MSDRQLSANQANARKSTGPKTAAGKSVAARNATRHGLLSSRLILSDEDPDEFAALTIDLQATLVPVGAMELVLVEKIAINMWRQRRLVRAESAALDLGRASNKIANAVSDQLCLGFGNDLKKEDLVPFDKSHASWCRAVIAEAESLGEIDLASLPKRSPLIYAQLKQDAEGDQQSLEEHLAPMEYGLTSYVHDLLSWCQTEIANAERRPEILNTADRLRDKMVILPQRELELLARYQTTLDNQLYKALRALRSAQDWRLKTLDAIATSSNSNECAPA